MIIPRKAFLGATTAFTSVNLYGAASAPAERVDMPRWRSVWFPDGRETEQSNLNLSPALTLDAQTMARLRMARPGDGMKGEQTVHIMQDEYKLTEFGR